VKAEIGKVEKQIEEHIDHLETEVALARSKMEECGKAAEESAHAIVSLKSRSRSCSSAFKKRRRL
jgi:hypothetical protein